MTNYLVVGAGLFGSVFASEAAKHGHTVNVIEKRDHVGGNIYTKDVNGTQVHEYGAHIFHTNNQTVWDYITQYSAFNWYINSPIANYKGEIYNLPFNMNTFAQMFGTATVEDAQKRLNDERMMYQYNAPANLEEQALKLVGPTIYNKLIKGYTEKQWGKECKDLPAFIIRRLPLRMTYDNNYFNATYQGIPVGGYTDIIETMLYDGNITVETNTDFKEHEYSWLQQYDKIVYTGAIDEFFDYKFGPLEYRSLRFETKELNMPSYQGTAVMNFTSSDEDYTRIIEHKYFDPEFSNKNKTVVTTEYPQKWEVGKERYYPVNDTKNNALYRKYRELAKSVPNVIFGGRLGMYRYMNMDEVISSALTLSRKEFGSEADD